MSGAHQQQSRRRRFPEKEPKIWWIPTVGTHEPITSLVPEISTVTTYLHRHPRILDEIILNLDKKKIEYLLKIQEARSNIKEYALGRWDSGSNPQKRYRHSATNVLNQDHVQECKTLDLRTLLSNTSDMLANALQVDWFSLYLPRNNNRYLYEYNVEDTKNHLGVIRKGTTVSAAAAFLGETLMVENLPQDDRYPKGVGHPERDVHSVLSIPIVFPSGDLHGVIELCKSKADMPFTKHDKLISNWLLGWMVCFLHQAHIGRVLELQSRLNDFLWDVTHDGQFSIGCVDNLVERILFFSKDLVNADRFAMFLVSEENRKLYADCFCNSVTDDGKPMFSTKKDFPFSCSEGIAGYVYTTGETVNISNVYEDDRFNAEVDELPGYYTKNILCMPIHSKFGVIGVIQMINSLSNDHFTNADESIFKSYASYCAMALHMSKVFKKHNLFKIQHKITMEVMENYIVAPKDEWQSLTPDTPPEMIPYSFFLYDFHACEFEEQLPQLFIYMIQDLFGKDVFDFTKLSKFVMTVRKNYRKLSFHNWIHGFQVAHSLYCMMKTNSKFWKSKEAMAMIIGGLCHDIDHRGYNNMFYQEFKLPFADLYGTSIMEHHHYKHTVTVLELKDHDIFSFLNSSQYTEMLSMIEDAIIATDPCFFQTNQNELAQMLENKTFNIRNDHSRRLFKALMMTAADLCGIAKPWHTQMKMVLDLYHEFYEQGDAEKSHGLQPTEVMDRAMRYNIPKQQAHFIRTICLPVVSILVQILPGCKPLLHGVEANLENWQKVVDERDEYERQHGHTGVAM
ncbi:cAMP and cAMP-inhibited cGMP 3',5'-cyclic phosphodiesterase 10A-like [Gigantopelta aegis]|uniref:cAMP and cAMP-inhibited cGMP 3',5'-cyclic phosphodiesterase 10A-like n=1 Tax=Gigantopelta aegis TaxID=1735272 RepID=UPI001B8890CB|nr:cAMP and cAMP-inhibited cGMP 3',5'-cyclic phosphodiesterase 10A-like [Gigantopelta aegis]